MADEQDAFYEEAPFQMICDIEIFMYTLGASFPGQSSKISA